MSKRASAPTPYQHYPPNVPQYIVDDMEDLRGHLDYVYRKRKHDRDRHMCYGAIFGLVLGLLLAFLIGL